MSEEFVGWLDDEWNVVLDQSQPIVRCRDCKYIETRGQRRYCNAHAGGYPEVALDDYCSWGERRNDERA